MRLRGPFFIAVVVLCWTFVGSLQPTEAQVNSCSALVQQAMSQLDSACTDLDRNTACYGYNRVDSIFNDLSFLGGNLPADFFSQPADRAPVDQLETISTHPFDLAQDLWGIAVLSVQANVPNALPGQNAVFMLMGDTEVTSTVDPDNVMPEVDPINVTLPAETIVLSSPNENANVLTLIAAGDEASLDAISEDGAFLRVYTERGLGWVQRDAIDPDVDISSLPAITGNEQTPMQAFHVRTAFNDLNCDQAPSLLAI